MADRRELEAVADRRELELELELARKKAGVRYRPAINRLLTEDPPVSEIGRGRFRAAANTIGSGFTPEAMGGGLAAVEHFQNRPLIQDPVSQVLDYVARQMTTGRRESGEQQALLDEARDRDPIGTTLTSVAGGILQGAGFLGRALPASTVKQALGSGGGIAGVAGFGEGEGTLGQRANQAMVSAPIGGALSIIGPGFEALKRRLAPGVLNRLGKLLDSTDMSPQQIKTRLRLMSMHSGDVKLADVDDNFRSVAEVAVKRIGKGLSREKQRLLRRDEGAFERISSFITDRIGGQARKAATVNQLKDIREQQAAPLYEQAKRIGAPMTSKLRNLFSRDGAQKAWKQAQKDIINDPDIDPAAILADDATPSIDGWIRINGALNDKINGLFRKGFPNRAKPLIKLRDAISDELDIINPKYAEARGLWASTKRADDMLELGEKFISEPADVVANIMENLDEADKVFYRMGAGRAIETRLSQRVNTTDMGRLFRTPDMGRKAEALFGNKADAKQFYEAINTEGAFKASSNQIVHGSRTKQLQTIEDQMFGGAIDSGATNKSGLISKATGQVGAAREATVQEIGRRLLSSDPGVIEDTLRMMQQAGIDPVEFGPFGAVIANVLGERLAR